MQRASRDLWVESQGNGVRVQNVLSGLEVVVSADELDSLDAPTLADVSANFEGKLGLQVNHAVNRYMREAWIRDLPDDPVERLLACRTHCLSRPQLDSEIERDLKAVFRTTECFLREDDDRTFEYQPGLLQAMWQRPALEYGFGQLPCMPETTQRRVAAARSFLKPESRGLVLGDDDLMGVCWSLLYKQPCDIFELDERLLGFYRDHSQGQLSFHQRDLTRGLPPEFHGRYDVIFTDPMYDRHGMDMFLACCSQGLSSSPEARLLLSTRPDLIEASDRLSERLAEVGLRIVRQHRGFSRYRLPDQTRRLALDSLACSPFPRFFLRGLLKVPYYYSDLLEVARIS